MKNFADIERPDVSKYKPKYGGHTITHTSKGKPSVTFRGENAQRDYDAYRSRLDEKKRERREKNEREKREREQERRRDQMYREQEARSQRRMEDAKVRSGDYEYTRDRDKYPNRPNTLEMTAADYGPRIQKSMRNRLSDRNQRINRYGDIGKAISRFYSGI